MLAVVEQDGFEFDHRGEGVGGVWEVDEFKHRFFALLSMTGLLRCSIGSSMTGVVEMLDRVEHDGCG